MNLNRIGNVERLIKALRDRDGISLGDLNSYEKFLDELMDYQDRVSSTSEVLRATADLIEEAMGKQGYNKI